MHVVRSIVYAGIATALVLSAFAAAEPAVSGSIRLAGFASNDGDTVVAPKEAASDAAVSFDSDGNVRADRVPWAPDVTRGVLTWIGLASDFGEGGSAGLSGEASVNEYECAFQTWGGEPALGYGFPPEAGCNLA